VYDPFSGSGTTIIAAEMTGRVCRAIELAPAYVDVAVRRWEAFTGQRATLESNDRTFAVIADERLKGAS
jgi:DNA modification methylase